MTNSSQSEVLDNSLATAAKSSRNGSEADVPGTRWNDQALLVERHRPEPTSFIQHLAIQSQILACLKWLSEFQVLACIPLSGDISAEEIADLAGVPETQLLRVVRMTATANFLQEPQPGQIAHTPLSAPFVTNLAFLDATMFLAETAAPAALHMAAATHRHGQQTAYSAALPAMQPFQAACDENVRLRRQWSAYRRCVGDVDDGVTELLGRLNWGSLGRACIVDACASSTKEAMALAQMHPSARFVVQILEPGKDNIDSPAAGLSGRISVQRRTPAAAQQVRDAAVYILRLTNPFSPLPAQVLAELGAHLDVLRANPSATLILALPLLPEPRAVSADAEAKARLLDLCLLQLTNQGEMELGELLELVNSVSDGDGRLVVASKLRSSQTATVALGVKYLAFTQPVHTYEGDHPLRT